MRPISNGFTQKIIDLHGEAGAAWLSRLADTIAECEGRWSVKVMPPFAPLSYNYVAPAVRADGTEVVLKLGVPHYDLKMEMEALRLFDGHGIVRLLKVDFDLGAMVLERLKPGSSLSKVVDDGKATSIAVQVMKQLWVPPPLEHQFPTVSDRAAGLERLRGRFGGATAPLPVALVERAEALFSDLIGSMGKPVLLHGDLHHFNILSAVREPWLAIDPKGVIGEPEYEVGAFLRNHLVSQTQPERLLTRRADQFADELGFDRGRILGWGLAQAVLAAWWSFEDSGQVWDDAITCAELFVTIAMK